MKDIVVASYCRSPFTPAHKGQLTRVRPDDLVAQTVKGLLKKTQVQASDIEDLILGCAFPEAEQGFNMARLVVFLAGLPQSVAGTTVNRFCGSSMQAIHMAAGAIQMDAGEAFICAGVESMTRVPMTGFNPLPNPGLYQSYPQAYMGMGDTAENLAEKYSIGREQQEAFTIDSQQKASRAQTAGNFNDEIVTIESHDGSRISLDGCIRPETTREALADLKPAFNQSGTVTAGTSSPLTDGAAAVLVCSEQYAKNAGLQPLGRIRQWRYF